jgi:hypothetical protein
VASRAAAIASARGVVPTAAVRDAAHQAGGFRPDLACLISNLTQTLVDVSSTGEFFDALAELP